RTSFQTHCPHPNLPPERGKECKVNVRAFEGAIACGDVCNDMLLAGNDSRGGPGALDTDFLADVKGRISHLCNANRHAVVELHHDVLARFLLRVFLRLCTGKTTGKRTGHGSNCLAGAAAEL